MAPSFQNFVFDTLDQFNAAESGDEKWIVAVQLCQQIGGCSLTMGAVNSISDLPIWMRSSMKSDWLTQYVDERFNECDPLVPHLKASNDPVVINCGVKLKSVKEQKLNDGLYEYGYQTIYGIPYGGDVHGERKMVAFSSDVDSDELLQEENRKLIHTVSAIIAANIGSPDASDSDGLLKFYDQPLSLREREMLCFLASGLRNDRIAEKTGLAEISVRKYIRSARHKMGANTRDQALAIAISRGLIDI